MIFKIGDICTYNRFECRVESIDETNKKLEISYAVFVNEERVFDENDRKIVPMSRVKLAHRVFEQFGHPPIEQTVSTPKSTHSVSPHSPTESLTFSVRRERFHIRTPKERPVGTKKKRKKILLRTPRIDLSDSSESAHASERKIYSRSITQKDKSGSRRRKSARKSREKISSKSPNSSGSSPVPIVPDSYLDSDMDSSSSGSSMSSSFVSETFSDEYQDNSESQFSQEREAMRQLATSYERRSAAEATHTVRDEVEFIDWDPRTKRVIGKELSSSFVLVDETDDPRRRSSVSPPAGRIEEIVEKFRLDHTANDSTASTAGSTVFPTKPPINLNDHIVNGLWKYVDTISVVDGWSKLDSLISALDEVVMSIQNSPNCSGNTATDLRMILTGGGPPRAKTHLGWFTIFYTTLLLTYNLKKQLFSRICETIFEKFSTKIDIKIIFLIAYVYVVSRGGSVGDDPPIKFPIFVSTLSVYPNQGSDIRKILRFFTSVVMDNFFTLFPPASVTEFLPFLSSLASHCTCPRPADVTVSINEFLENADKNSFIDKILNFIVSNFPPVGGLVLIRCGGFIPPVDTGSTILSFSKLKGKNFHSVLRYERGFCDWVERLPEPFSAECVDFIDFVCLDRYWCSLGPRTLRADIEYIRLAKENIGQEQVELWLENRGLICGKIFKFFTSLSEKFPANNNCLEYVSYARCAYDTFRYLVPAIGYSDPLVSRIHSLPKPRGEFVKEVVRPLMRLADLFPVFKKRIHESIVHARAEAYECSIETAVHELRSFHGIIIAIN